LLRELWLPPPPLVQWAAPFVSAPEPFARELSVQIQALLVPVPLGLALLAPGPFAHSQGRSTRVELNFRIQPGTALTLPYRASASISKTSQVNFLACWVHVTYRFVAVYETLVQCGPHGVSYQNESAGAI
jgi:hypothetical protein